MTRRAVTLTAKREPTNLERTFDTLMRQCAPDFPEPLCNYRFDSDSLIEIDRYWVNDCVGVELNGGTWARGKMGHNSGKGIERDYRKLARCHELGIKLFFFTSSQVLRDPDYVFGVLRKFVGVPFAEKLRREFGIPQFRQTSDSWRVKWSK